MRLLVAVAVLAVTAACGAYSFPPGPGAQSGHVSGSVRVVPCAPVEQQGQACNGLMGNGLTIIFANGSSTATTTVDGDGNYGIDLAAGTWQVRVKGIARIISGPTSVTVPAGGSIHADFVVDSGIRVPGPAAAAS